VGSEDFAPVTGYYRPGRSRFEAWWDFILGVISPRQVVMSRISLGWLSKSRRLYWEWGTETGLGEGIVPKRHTDSAYRHAPKRHTVRQVELSSRVQVFLKGSD
jgi:hypothetical protein